MSDTHESRTDEDHDYPATPDQVIALIEEAERTGVWPRHIRGDALRTICYVSAQSTQKSAEERAAWARAEARLMGRLHGGRAGN